MEILSTLAEGQIWFNTLANTTVIVRKIRSREEYRDSAVVELISMTGNIMVTTFSNTGMWKFQGEPAPTFQACRFSTCAEAAGYWYYRHRLDADPLPEVVCYKHLPKGVSAHTMSEEIHQTLFTDTYHVCPSCNEAGNEILGELGWVPPRLASMWHCPACHEQWIHKLSYDQDPSKILLVVPKGYRVLECRALSSGDESSARYQIRIAPRMGTCTLGQKPATVYDFLKNDDLD